MNKNMKKMLSLLAVLLCLSACDDWGVETDYIPIELVVTVCDADGNDLLDSTVVGNLVDGAPITATYKDEEYTCKGYREVWYPDTRTYMPNFYGLKFQDKYQYNKDIPSTGYTEPQKRGLLLFGEFSGEQKHDLTEVTLHWPDGTQDVIAFKNHRAGVSHCTYYLNGKKTTLPIHITK